MTLSSGTHKRSKGRCLQCVRNPSESEVRVHSKHRDSGDVRLSGNVPPGPLPHPGRQARDPAPTGLLPPSHGPDCGLPQPPRVTGTLPRPAGCLPRRPESAGTSARSGTSVSSPRGRTLRTVPGPLQVPPDTPPVGASPWQGRAGPPPHRERSRGPSDPGVSGLRPHTGLLLLPKRPVKAAAGNPPCGSEGKGKWGAG